MSVGHLSGCHLFMLRGNRVQAPAVTVDKRPNPTLHNKNDRNIYVINVIHTAYDKEDCKLLRHIMLH
jgi:hypothetical protein